MTHYFYQYRIYLKDDVEYTLLKWFHDNDYFASKKIDKPTTELTSDDIDILHLFLNNGAVVHDKIDLPITQNNDIIDS